MSFDPRYGPGPEGPWGRRNPHRLWRDPQHRWIAGVCAGLAAFAGVDVAVARLAALFGLVLFFPPVALGYLVLAIALPVKPTEPRGTPDEQRFWRMASTAPNRAVGELTERFRTIDRRLAAIETLVTSEEYHLRRKFRDMGA